MIYRFATDCLTGIRRWRWYGVVGRPDRSVLWPCAKAAIIIPPLLGLPGSIAAFRGGWPEDTIPNTQQDSETPLPASAGITHPRPGEGLLTVPGPISQYETPLNSMPTVIQNVPVDFVDNSPSTHIPEPASIVVLAVGAGAAALVKRGRG